MQTLIPRLALTLTLNQTTTLLYPKPVHNRKPRRLDTHGGQVHANRCTYGELHAVSKYYSDCAGSFHLSPPFSAASSSPRVT
eukprot:2498210-Pyramimonas_sp.AAC.1